MDRESDQLKEPLSAIKNAKLAALSVVKEREP